MNVQQSNRFSPPLTKRHLALALTCAALLAGLLFFGPRASLTAPPDEAQQGRRGGTGGGKPRNFFIHDKNHIRYTKQGTRITANCDECHRIPGAFYLAENVLGYNVREFPDHPDCLRCHEHRQDFFRGATPPICTVCHKGASPREGNPGLFPKAGGPDVERDFTGRFPHGKHQDILALQQPARANEGFRIVKAGFRAQDKKPVERWDCGRCHQSYPSDVEKQLLANIDWSAAQKAFNVPLAADAQKVLYVNDTVLVKEDKKDVPAKSPLLDKSNNLPLGMKPDDKDPTAPAGTFKQSPNGPTGHKFCFECHALTQGAWNSPYPRANDCVGCHGLGRALEPPKPEAEGVAKTIKPLTLTDAGRKGVTDPALLQKYRNDPALLEKYTLVEVPTLLPRISYKYQHDITAHDLECTVCHVNITRQETLSVSNPDVPMTACAACHLNKSSGGNISVGDQSLNLEAEINRRQTNPQYVCIACHTPDTGKNPPPDSHYAVLGRGRF